MSLKREVEESGIIEGTSWVFQRDRVSCELTIQGRVLAA